MLILIKTNSLDMELDRTGVSLLSDGSFGRNVVIFVVDMSSSAHLIIKEKTF